MTVIINGTSGITYPSNTTQNTAYQTRFKNRFINGNMVIAQRANSATVTAGTAVPTASTGYPAVDRWFVYSTGANVTAAQVAGSNNTQNNYQITGAASVTAVGVGQRIENNNSYDLSGQTVTLSANISNSLLTNVTWTASYANTSNTFGTIGTPTKVQISTGTFTINSTLSTYTTQISIPAAATTGIEILFTVGAQTSGTWVIGNAQLELGNAASSFEVVNYSDQLFMCQRYYETYALSSTSLVGASTSTTVAVTVLTFKVTKRTAPTITLPAAGQTSGTVSFLTATGDYPTATGTNAAASITVDKTTINGTGYTGLTLGSTSHFFSSSTSTIQINAEL